MTNLPIITTEGGFDPSERRAIKQVFDLSRPEGQQLRAVAAVLDPLTPAMLSDLRRDTETDRLAGAPRFLCASCREPVDIRHSSGVDAPADGRGAHFRHPTGGKQCKWRTPLDLHVTARKYPNHEGGDHSFLKMQLAECLSCDERFSDVQLEKQVTMPEGMKNRRPDVSANFLGHRLAVDLQLSTTGLKVVIGREEGYRATGHHHIWVTAPDFENLTKKTFTDIRSGTGGRIFVIDDGSVAATIQTGQLKLRELSLAPRLVEGRALHNIWNTSLIGADVIMTPAERRKAEGIANYHKAMEIQADAAFGALRHRIRAYAAAALPLKTVLPAWRSIAAYVEGDKFDRAISDGVGEVLAFLQQVELCCLDLMVETDTAMLDELRRRTGIVLGRWGWAPLVALVEKLVPDFTSIMTQAQAAQLRKATSENGGSQLSWWVSMLAILYPWLSYDLLAKAPKFAPKLPGLGGTA